MAKTIKYIDGTGLKHYDDYIQGLMVKTVNGVEPDANGNIKIATSDGSTIDAAITNTDGAVVISVNNASGLTAEQLANINSDHSDYLTDEEEATDAEIKAIFEED